MHKGAWVADFCAQLQPETAKVRSGTKNAQSLQSQGRWWILTSGPAGCLAWVLGAQLLEPVVADAVIRDHSVVALQQTGYRISDVRGPTSTTPQGLSKRTPEDC